MGEIQQNVAQDVGDFVLRRADQIIAYQLAVVVDDGAMNINQVVRGADLLDSTPRQIQLFQALDLPIPRFAHIPLVLNADGERLAKRDQSTNIRALRHAGIQADELLGILGHSLGLRDTPGACTLGHLVDAFAWEKLSRKPWVCSGVLKKIMD